jgi:HAD superfamily hydrolase (TIGR01509 family)
LTLYNALVTRSRHLQAIAQCASAIIEMHELRGVDKAAPLPGAIDLLLSLRAHDKRVAIVTSNSSLTVRRWLTRHRINREVGTIVGRDSLLPLKPAPDMINRAINLSGSRMAEAVLVGDSDADLKAAQNAHISFLGVAVNRKARTSLEELGARRIFSSPADLARRLFGFSGDGIDGPRL